jgi:hypothetical protein
LNSQTVTPPGSSATTQPVYPAYQPAAQQSAVIGFPQETFIEEQFISPFPARLVKPEENRGVFLAGNGDLFEKTPRENIYTKVGHLRPDGWFTLVDDPAPKFIFHNPVLGFNPYALNGPLAKALQRVHQEMIERSAETRHIRQNLTSRGIDGRGCQAFCIEPGIKDIKGRFQALDHTRLVRATINDPARGYAPAMSANPAAFLVDESNLQLNAKIDNAATAQVKFITDMANSFHRVADLIEAIANQPPVMDPTTGQPQQRLINMSIGLNPLVTAQIIYSVLESQSTEGVYEFDSMRAEFYGPNHKDLKQYEKLNILIPKAIEWFQTDDRIKEAFTHYANAVSRATEQGIPVIVAAGNEQNEFPLKTNIPHIARFNWLALPKDVICVAASNNSQTPGVVADDTISDFSNHGDSVVKNPTIAATGENVVHGKQYTNSAPGGASSGTSFAAPIITSTAGMIYQVARQQGAGLSVEELRYILQSAAVRNQTTVQEAGAGIVDPVRAIAVAESYLQQRHQGSTNALSGGSFHPSSPFSPSQQVVSPQRQAFVG